MKHLHDIKNWESFLDDEIMIAQKVDGTAIIIKYLNKQIRFYGREGKKELNIIQRSLNDLYEDAIEYLTPRVQDILKKEGQLLAFEYFPDKIKPIIPVIVKPKNNLILLYTNNITESLYSLAKKLDVSEQPIIFTGTLNKEQKEFILTRNFTPETIKMINPSFKFIVNPKMMEGLIIQNLKTGDTYKVTNIDFTDIIKAKKQNSNTELKEYNKELLNIVMHFYIDIPKNYKYSSKNFLDVMFKNIENQQNIIINKYASNFIGKDNISQIDTFINWKMYPPEIQKNMKIYPWFRDFVWLLISNYSKDRKRIIQGIDKETFKRYLEKVKLLLQENKNLTRLYSYLLFN